MDPAPPDQGVKVVPADVELAELKEKFASWKTKAKAGVDQLRGQLVEVQAQLNEKRTAAMASADRAAAAEARAEALEQDLEAARAHLAGLGSQRHEELVATTVDAPGASHANEQLREAAWVSKCDLLLVAVADALRIANATMHDAESRVQAHQQAAASALASRDELQRELERQRSDHERFKTRSTKTLQLTSQRADDATARLEAAERAAQRAADAHASLAVKDKTIAAVEVRLEDALAQLAQIAMQRDLIEEELANARAEIASLCGAPNARRSLSRRRDADGPDADLDAAVQDAVAIVEAAAEVRLREELEALSAAHREELEEREVEVAQLRLKIAASEAKRQQQKSSGIASWIGLGSGGQAPEAGGAQAVDEEDVYVKTLRQQLEQARQETDSMRLERDQATSQVRRLQGKVDGMNRAHARDNAPTTSAGQLLLSTDGAATLADCSPEELRRQVVLKSEQLWDANQQVLQLRAALKSASAQQQQLRRGGSGGDVASAESIQQTRYLRAVLVNFFTASSDDVRAGLMPVLATLLRLTADELRATFAANPDWIS